MLVSMKNIRRRLFEVIEQSKNGDKFSLFYDVFMIAVVVVSLLPLGFKEEYPVFDVTNICAAIIFAID